MTRAEAISALLHDDGQCWESDDGRGLDELCSEHTRRDVHGRDTYRYVFSDGSVITVAGDGWDLGYAGCYCWHGAGHHEDCEVSR